MKTRILMTALLAIFCLAVVNSAFAQGMVALTQEGNDYYSKVVVIRNGEAMLPYNPALTTGYELMKYYISNSGESLAGTVVITMNISVLNATGGIGNIKKVDVPYQQRNSDPKTDWTETTGRVIPTSMNTGVLRVECPGMFIRTNDSGAFVVRVTLDSQTPDGVTIVIAIQSVEGLVGQVTGAIKPVNLGMAKNVSFTFWKQPRMQIGSVKTGEIIPGVPAKDNGKYLKITVTAPPTVLSGNYLLEVRPNGRPWQLAYDIIENPVTPYERELFVQVTAEPRLYRFSKTFPQ